MLQVNTWVLFDTGSRKYSGSYFTFPRGLFPRTSSLKQFSQYVPDEPLSSPTISILFLLIKNRYQQNFTPSGDGTHKILSFNEDSALLTDRNNIIHIVNIEPELAVDQIVTPRTLVSGLN